MEVFLGTLGRGIIWVPLKSHYYKVVSFRQEFYKHSSKHNLVPQELNFNWNLWEQSQNKLLQSKNKYLNTEDSKTRLST